MDMVCWQKIITDEGIHTVFLVHEFHIPHIPHFVTTKKMNAEISYPWAVFVSNGEVFICDSGNNCVRKVLATGQIVTITGKGLGGYLAHDENRLATDVQLYRPMSVVVSSSDQVYISDEDYLIRKIDRNGIMSTIAGAGRWYGNQCGGNGDGKLAIDARLYEPRGLFVTDDEEVFICDYGKGRVRRIDRNGMISTVAGTCIEGYNGDEKLASDAQLNSPTSVFVHRNEIYITDTHNRRILKVLQNGIIKTIAGTGENGYNGDDQPATSANLSQPQGLYVHNDHIYFSDCFNHRIRVILPNGIIKTVAGTVKTGYNGDEISAIEAKLEFPAGIFVDDSGIYIACKDARIRKIDCNGIISTIVGTGKEGYSGDVPFDFHKYPHIGPKKKPLIKPFPKSFHDIVITSTTC